jgi:hypothetical protein
MARTLVHPVPEHPDGWNSNAMSPFPVSEFAVQSGFPLALAGIGVY